VDIKTSTQPEPEGETLEPCPVEVTEENHPSEDIKATEKTVMNFFKTFVSTNLNFANAFDIKFQSLHLHKCIQKGFQCIQEIYFYLFWSELNFFECIVLSKLSKKY